ncbi:MAG TPA: protoporphyrinogen oxidase HemJ [Alphaproteobacteria bacterium]|nr:protoporphyrinogen oxidase HemJ [Alphaproteobacteria bacterium]
MSWMVGVYPWVKALHVISVIAWMAGLLYLPRLFVYHVEVAAGSAEDRRFQLMERRLLRQIMNPAMIATYVFGLLLAGTPGAVDWGQGWMYVKLAGVLALTGVHHAMGRWRKGFAAGQNRHPGWFYRVMNEVPTLLMIAIVVMVVVKPF